MLSGFESLPPSQSKRFRNSDEAALTKAVRELIGDSYHVTVGEVNFDMRAWSDRLDITDVSIAIRRELLGS